MEERVFSNAKFVQALSENFVLVKLIVSNGQSDTEIVKKRKETIRQKFDLQGYPTMLLLNSNLQKYAEAENYGPDSDELAKRILAIQKEQSQ